MKTQTEILNAKKTLDCHDISPNAKNSVYHKHSETCSNIEVLKTRKLPKYIQILELKIV